ncbi:large ribosomal subunit protein uL3 [Candidatus Vidania fulgoroideorum]
MFFGTIGIKQSMLNIISETGIFLPITKLVLPKITILNKVNNIIYISLLYKTLSFSVSKKVFDRIKIGSKLENNFLKIKKVKTTSLSKGKGFTGVIKRYNFKSNRQSHGNSKAHNKPGSIGMCQDPGRVFKGKKMSGRMGFKKVSKYNKVFLSSNNLLYLYGSIPGKYNSYVKITPYERYKS